MSTIPSEALEDIFHPAMSSPGQLRPVRYEIGIEDSTGLLESMVISFRSQDGQQKKLRFMHPALSDFGPLQIPNAQHLYVADLSSLGWASQRHLEVGEWEEEHATMFWACSVEEIG